MVLDEKLIIHDPKNLSTLVLSNYALPKAGKYIVYCGKYSSESGKYKDRFRTSYLVIKFVSVLCQFV